MDELERAVLGPRGRPVKRKARGVDVDALRRMHVQKGRDAFSNGKMASDNPWDPEASPNRHAAWLEGFRQAREAQVGHG